MVVHHPPGRGVNQRPLAKSVLVVSVCTTPCGAIKMFCHILFVVCVACMQDVQHQLPGRGVNQRPLTKSVLVVSCRHNSLWCHKDVMSYCVCCLCCMYAAKPKATDNNSGGTLSRRDSLWCHKDVMSHLIAGIRCVHQVTTGGGFGSAHAEKLTASACSLCGVAVKPCVWCLCFFTSGNLRRHQLKCTGSRYELQRGGTIGTRQV